jgi:hypothetical protein
MQPMSDGMDLNPEVLVQVLQNKLAQAAIRENQMEAAIQQLIMEKAQLEQQLKDRAEETTPEQIQEG